MGIDEDRFEDKVAAEFICGICLDVMERPVCLVDCEHTFCRSCINLWMSKTDLCYHMESRICPLDRKTIHSIEEPDDLFHVLYSSLRMRCINFPYCQSELTVGDYEDHDKQCQFTSQLLFNDNIDHTILE